MRPFGSFVVSAVFLGSSVTLAFPGSRAGSADVTTDPAGRCGPATELPVADVVVDPGDGGDYAPHLDAESVAATIDNAYYPLIAGSEWRYESQTDEGLEEIVVRVTDETRIVMGIDAVVVRDTVRLDGELIEDTYDWFVQDTDGNVWYLGEDTTSFEDGATSTEGSWEAGVRGALPGIVMPANAAVGDAYRQEFCGGEAEDMMMIVAIDGAVTVAAGSYEAVVTTNDWTPLEPDIVEAKDYAPGVGLIRETKVEGDADGITELVSFTPGSAPN